MVRPPSFDSNGMKKGAWSEEEDNKLKAYVMRYGHWNWRLLPKFAGLARCGKSCRLRWVNYLKPGVRRGNFTKEEEDLIIKLHAQLGNKWSAIAAKLPGRTDNEIKNFWHTRVEKRGKRNPVAKKVVGHTNEASSKDDQVIMEEERGFEITHSSQKSRDESASSSEATSLDQIQQSELLFDTNTSLLPPITQQSQVDLWPDRLLEDTNYDQNGCFLPMIDGGFYYPELQYGELSSSDSSYLSGLDWIADDGHSILSSAPSFHGNLWSESASSSNSSNSQSESNTSAQEVGGQSDSLLHIFDYGVNLFSY